MTPNPVFLGHSYEKNLSTQKETQGPHPRLQKKDVDRRRTQHLAQKAQKGTQAPHGGLAVRCPKNSKKPLVSLKIRNTRRFLRRGFGCATIF